jgi:hypothetical protein
MSDKDRSAQGLSRRDFLRIAGVVGVKTLIPDLGEPDPPEPVLKSREKLSESDIIKLALPIHDRLDFLANRMLFGSTGMKSVPNWPDIVEGEALGHETLKRRFPDFSLENVKNTLRSLDQNAWITPYKLFVFAYPQLHSFYRTAFDIYPVKPDASGRLVMDGQIGDAYQRGKLIIPRDAVEIVGGSGLIGELWKFNTSEDHPFGSLEINWLAKRGIPYIDKAYSSDTPFDRMANIFSGSPEFYYRNEKGSLFAMTASEDVLFIPIGLKLTPRNDPGAHPEFNA